LPLARVVTPFLSGVSHEQAARPRARTLQAHRRPRRLREASGLRAPPAGRRAGPHGARPRQPRPHRRRPHPNGFWVYASVPDYTLRAPSEPAAEALARLRGAIDRSQDKGTIVDFVQQRGPLAGRADVPLDQVRDRLRSFRATGLPLDFEGPLCPPPYPRSRERALERDRDPLPEGGSGGSKSELNRRRYDWSPPVENGPRETEGERRLRAWREAQAAIDRRQRAAREVQPPAPPAPQPA